MTVPKGLMIVGDAHLSQRMYSKRPEIEGDSYCLLEQAVDAAIAGGHDVIFLGDQFNVNYPPIKDVDIWLHEMGRLIDHGCTPYIIDGNHDPGLNNDDEEKSWSCVESGVVHINPAERFCANGICFTGFDYQATLARAQDQLAKCLVHSDALIVMHQFPKQYTKIQIDGVADVDLTLIKDKRDVFCGHIHDNFETPLDGGGSLYVVGSTHPRTKAEGSQKYYYVLTKTETGYDTAKIPFVHRKIFAHHVIHEEDLPTILADIKKEILCEDIPKDAKFDRVRRPLLSITYDPQIVGVMDSVKRVVGDQAHIFEIPKFKYKTSLVTDVTSEVESVNLLEIVSSTVEDEHMRKAMLKLLDSPEDTEVIIQDYIKSLKVS